MLGLSIASGAFWPLIALEKPRVSADMRWFAISLASIPTGGKGGHSIIQSRTWAAGDTSQTVRDIIQAKLLGPIEAFGTGLIRKALIVRTTSRQGIPDAVQDIYVKHKGGGISWLTLKSYDQKRLSFQGTGKHVIWLDDAWQWIGLLAIVLAWALF